MDREIREVPFGVGAGARRWIPETKRSILAEPNGTYVEDLDQWPTAIDRAHNYVRETVSRGGTIMFIGTKEEVQEAIAEQATRVGMPYVSERWLGGTLTNFQTVLRRLQRLKDLEQIDLDDDVGSGIPKKELLALRREKDKLERTLGGIRDMSKLPSAVWVVDTNKERIAVGEARKLGVPVIAISDSKSDPKVVDIPVPLDESVGAVSRATRRIADAVAEGLRARVSDAGQADRDRDAQPGASGQESAEITRLKRENVELKRENVELKRENVELKRENLELKRESPTMDSLAETSASARNEDYW